jgi:hypothetical protein
VEFIVDNLRIFALGGMLGPVLYTLIWVLGGFLQPDYSHIRDDVSSLMAVGAPHKRLFDLMQTADVLLMMIFFTSLHWAIEGGEGSILGPACFVASNVVGLAVVLFYPLDEGGGIESSRAQMHVKLVGLMSVLAMVGMVAMWLRFMGADGWAGFSQYTLATFVVTLATGLFAVRTAGSEIMGLTERLVVTANVQYFFVLALKVYLSTM